MTTALQSRVLAHFDAVFGGRPELIARAPGRVNLIGEHTDYNDGFVFPCALSRETNVAARRRDDEIVLVSAADYAGALDRLDLHRPITQSNEHPWANYVRGVVVEMRRAGFVFGGAEFAIAGDVPKGAGLSSSASLEVAVAGALAALSGRGAPDLSALAAIAQKAENEFVGVKCGIMDQLVSARAEERAALLIDCRSLDCIAHPFPPGTALMIVHSGVVRGLVDGAYNERRRQCEVAAQALGVSKLRDASEDLLAFGAARLHPVELRRARHVIRENRRTLDAAVALAADDLRALGRLMRESHRSMREDFEITHPEVDRLADLLNDEIGEEGGARMTGGGFGGCVVALAREAKAVSVAERVKSRYVRPDGKPVEALIETPSAGVSIRRLESALQEP